MPDITITELDLSDGIKAKNLVVPAMPVAVVLKNPSADLQKALKADKLVLQKMAEAAFEKLNKAREDVRGAIADIDAGYAKRPPADKAEAEERAATLTAMCKKVAEAQSDAASAAAEAAWEKQAKKNKDLAVFKAVFGLKMTLGTISVAASVIAAVLSVGTLAITVIGAAKTVVSMASDVYNFCRDMAKAEQDIVDTDAELAKSWENKKLTAGKVGKELAAALGVPFVKTIGGLEKLLEEYNAKNAKKDAVADSLWKKAKDMMAAIEKAPDRMSAEQKKTLDALGAKVTDLLNEIGELVKTSKSNDLFYEVYDRRLTTYQEMEGKALGGSAKLTGIGVVAAGVLSTANTVVDIAMKLA